MDDALRPDDIMRAMCLEASADNADWLEHLPVVMARMQASTGVQLHGVFSGGIINHVCHGHDRNGRPVVVKFAPPSARDTQDIEVRALTTWQGGRTIGILDHHREDAWMLLERADPGVTLHELAWENRLAVQLAIADDLHARSPAAPDPGELERHHEWVKNYRLRILALWEGCEIPFPAHQREPFDAAFDALLDPQAPGLVLNHGDLHAGNILRHGDRWVAIDPQGRWAPRWAEAEKILRDDAIRIPALENRDALHRRAAWLAEHFAVPVELIVRDAIRQALCMVVQYAHSGHADRARANLDFVQALER